MKRNHVLGCSCLLLISLQSQQALSTVVGPDPSFTSLRIGGCFQSWLRFWEDFFVDYIDTDQDSTLYTSWDGDTSDGQRDHALMFYADGTGLRTLTATSVDDDGAVSELEVVWALEWRMGTDRLGEIRAQCDDAVRYVDGDVDANGCDAVEARLGEDLSFQGSCQSREAGQVLQCDERGKRLTLYRVD